MRKWLLGLLLAIPLVDAAVLAWLGTLLGWAEVVLLVVLTALIGGLLVRAEGRRTIRGIQRSLAEGEPPTDGLIDGGLLIAAGAFLLTPGVVTDAIGFLLVIPVTRAPIRWALKRWIIVPKLDEKTGGFASGNVYTFGFPQPGENEGVDPEDFDLGGPGPFGSTATEETDQNGEAGGSGPSGDDTVDLGSDEYDVEDDDR
ncbi:phage T7 F exclusion suppressor FxsA [Salinarchaeum sp. Harcht-Bsk1]|uniref:FxsA family protein n=1 Tax=Salinarchaeum sp. Harcht-Bsk1 TaxID=1333523 RepID=UPI00034245CF|nr:FxsA family protein [Salinarchaeum sp. Harcht-Bsk1]AGN02144.1 phage T7 F exclusion suppressor FxsA [Salinarchaeum sp. Harcht-Bsk1]